MTKSVCIITTIQRGYFDFLLFALGSNNFRVSLIQKFIAIELAKTKNNTICDFSPKAQASTSP